MSEYIVVRKIDCFIVSTIILIFIGFLVYGFSMLKQNQTPTPSPSTSGEMSEECKKIWLEQGEAVAEQNGC
jgi:hypothetical protein